MSRTRMLLAAAAVLALSAGCLRRDVAAEEPTTKISFETVVPQPAIDKVDLLVMVDNSSSMADKQRILADAVPDLLRGLVQPKCVTKKTRVPTGTLADPLKADGEQCPEGSEPAFTPITDMHIGVISSSLGGLGATKTCKADEPGRNNDDKGHLLARDEGGKPVPEAGELGFLAWYPDVAQNQNKARHPDPPVPASASIKALSDSFQKLVVGVGQRGCGLEAQLESVYRFLVQPDPWTKIEVDGNKHASYGAGVDGELLRQRAAFLRPDSLVAIVVLSDEDDSSADPLSFDGTGWIFGEDQRVSRGTSACATDPASPSCTSCELVEQCDAKDPTCAKLKSDPACAAGKGIYQPAEDSINVRFHAMKRRFGVDPQFPIARYVDAFTKTKVPSRANEHERGTYVGKADCTNPLFAARLPSQPNDDLCKLPRGARTADNVYFAVIGGVPNGLLPADGLSASIDWTQLLGKDPSRYDQTGINPHMIPSTEPRGDLPGPSSADDADPVHGREWNTNGTDLQFACTFDLYERDATGAAVPTRRECPKDDKTCDCDGVRSTPLCDKANPRIQIKGKAYPTRRELMVAKELGDHAVVASLCPKQLTAPESDDYGYRPAARAITKRLEDSLTASCLPRELVRDADGVVPCMVVATLPEPGSDEVCTKLGLGIPKASLVAQIRDRVAAEEGEESRRLPICEVPQVAVPPGESCRDEDRKQGFCYAENLPGITCGHSLLFTKPTTHLVGARFSLQCIQVASSP